MEPLCGVRHWSTLSYLGMGLKQWICAFCGTAFQSNIVGYGSEGLAFVVTKWMDLGRGLNQDQDWDMNFVLQEFPERGSMLTMKDNGPIPRWWEDNEGESRYVPTLSKAQEKVLGIPIRKGTHDPAPVLSYEES
ncbi:hypothetical protein BPAE_0066g00170 [Botrytis paeoniae]|uniref:Uncharacterized protein n=1 Tax=Botrytis paeoniae TaxID=278948 RepID=A0A4Z1FWJ1_9HELO|nr:hypothetical protein BPAE_0066g00170 [Botrytis paeoniae]